MSPMKKLLLLSIVGSLASVVPMSQALATPITGSDTVGAVVSSSNEVSGNLGTATQFTLASAVQTFSMLSTGAGSFSVIPIGTTVALPSTLLDLASAASFGFTDAGVGTFAPTTLVAYNQTATSLDIFLTGSFTPGTDFPAGSTALAGASETLALTQTNAGVISLSGTFASPPSTSPVPVPEPLTIALFGAGLLGLPSLRRRGKKQVSA